MGCGNCGSSHTDGGSCTSPGCGSNGDCGTMACNKLNAYNWLNHMVLPSDYKPFNIVEVRFKGSRKEFFKNEEDLDLYTGQAIIVESEMGHDLGHVSLSGELVRLQLKKAGLREGDANIRKIYRLATDKDKETYTQYKAKELSILERARTIAMEMNLAMKLSDIDFQADGRKVIFFYTAEDRVDFRMLIKQYASEFKTRIEMRQVSYREEASRLGAIGSCGRELCCSTWLTDYKLVTMSSARTQNLSINMLKLSGQCGRLKCCLNYELETYLEALDEFPKTDRLKLETAIGPAYLQKTDILKRMLWFSYPKSSDWIAIKLERVNDIIEMNKNGERPETLLDQQYASMLIEHVGPAADLISDQSLNRMDDLEQDRKNKRSSKGPKNKKPGFKGKNRREGNQPNPNPNPNQQQPQKRNPDDRPRPENPNRRREGEPRNNDQKPADRTNPQNANNPNARPAGNKRRPPRPPRPPRPTE